MAYRSHYRTDDMTGWTYFIAAPSEGLVKIGAAKEFWPRYQSIQSCSPVPLELAALITGRGFEPQLHRLWADYRVRGEWFEASAPGLGEFIREHAFTGLDDIYRTSNRLVS